MEKLTEAELDVILESLQHSERKVREYTQYPSYEYKQQRIKEIASIRLKVLSIKRGK